MIHRRTISLLAGGLLIAAASAFGQPITLPTVATLTTSSNLPPFGIAMTETAQVNVVNTAAAASGGTAASCSGTIAFFNAAGALIGSAVPFTSLGTGKIFSATLLYSATGGTGSRVVVRAEITDTSTLTGFSTAPCSLSSSLEIFDTSTGVAHAFVSGTTTLSPIAVTGAVVANPLAVVH
jgi:hypothetical protein